MQLRRQVAYGSWDWGSREGHRTVQAINGLLMFRSGIGVGGKIPIAPSQIILPSKCTSAYKTSNLRKLKIKFLWGFAPKNSWDQHQKTVPFYPKRITDLNKFSIYNSKLCFPSHLPTIYFSKVLKTLNYAWIMWFQKEFKEISRTS